MRRWEQKAAKAFRGFLETKGNVAFLACRGPLVCRELQVRESDPLQYPQNESGWDKVNFCHKADPSPIFQPSKFALLELSANSRKAKKGRRCWPSKGEANPPFRMHV